MAPGGAAEDLLVLSLRRNRIVTTLVTAAAAAAPATAGAAVRVVAPTGKDSNPGGLIRPWRTLQHAADVAAPGTVVVVRPGRYAGFQVARSGLPGRPIVFRGQPGALVVSPSRGWRAIVDVENAHDVVISGLRISGAAGQFSAGIRTNGGARVRILSNQIVLNHGFGVNIANTLGFVVAANTIAFNATGVQVQDGASGLIARNAIALNREMIVNTPGGTDDRGANGIVFYRTLRPVRATLNHIWGNRARSFDYGWDGGAFEIFEASGVAIDHNVVWDNENVLETGTAGRPCAGNSFFRNIAYGAVTRGRAMGLILRCASGMLVANNTLYGIQGFAFDVAGSGPYAGSIAGLRIVNNIAVTRAAHPYSLETGGAYAIDHNVVWSAPAAAMAYVAGHGNAPNLATFRAWTGHEAHGLFTRPLLTAPARHVYTLQPASPARHRGIPVPGVTVGPKPDAGAY